LTAMGKKRQPSQRQPAKFPSAYRYMGLGLLLPIFVFIGMIIGYNYGATIGDFYPAIFAAVGSITGLIVATVIIVKIVLFWDKRILRALKKSRTKPSQV
jgi:hypothetical protein